MLDSQTYIRLQRWRLTHQPSTGRRHLGSEIYQAYKSLPTQPSLCPIPFQRRFATVVSRF